MNLVAMNIPDDPAALPGWLESHLVGPDLGRLTAELTAIHGDHPAGSLAAVLGDCQQCWDIGLGVLPAAAVLRQLLQHPQFLLELQELVLHNGGTYWDGLSAGDELEQLAAAGLRQIRDRRGTAVVVPPPRPAGRAGNGSRGRRAWPWPPPSWS